MNEAHSNLSSFRFREGGTMRRNADSSSDEDNVAHVRPRKRHGLNFHTAYPFGSVVKQGNGVSSVTVVTCVWVGNLVPSMLVDRFAVFVSHVVHFQRCEKLRSMGRK
jgi:hypothetical protein